jgi:hypothetical protein
MIESEKVMEKEESVKGEVALFARQAGRGAQALRRLRISHASPLRR